MQSREKLTPAPPFRRAAALPPEHDTPDPLDGNYVCTAEPLSIQAVLILTNTAGVEPEQEFNNARATVAGTNFLDCGPTGWVFFWAFRYPARPKHGTKRDPCRYNPPNHPLPRPNSQRSAKWGSGLAVVTQTGFFFAAIIKPGCGRKMYLQL